MADYTYPVTGCSMTKEKSIDPSEIQFHHNPHSTLGVEIEFQVLDRESLNLAPLAPLMINNSPEILRPRITLEFIQSILELQTGICHSVKDVENDLMETCSMAEELAGNFGCVLYAASLHPFASHTDQRLTANERYERIMDELQIVGRQFISQGLHVHVGVADGDTAIRVCNSIQPYLPLLLSLSASSPFFEGVDTGLMSYRTKLFEVLPLAGVYEYMPDWFSFLKEVELLKKHNVIRSIKDLWWDARPHPDFGTVEIRICDLPSRFGDILGLVAFIQGLVAHLAELNGSLRICSQQILRANKWQAVRHGLNGVFIDPTGYLGDDQLDMPNAISMLLKKVGPKIQELGASEYITKLERVIRWGTSADHQRSLYKNSGDLKQVIEKSHREFWE